MLLDENEKAFLKAIKCALCGEHAVFDEVEYGKIFNMALEQKLLPFVFEAVRKTPAANRLPELFAAAKQKVINQVVGQTIKSMEFDEIYGKLTASGLHPVVIKGKLCQKLYPLAEHRLSADDDIFVSDEEVLACHKILVANGFTTSCSKEELLTQDEISYTKSDSSLYIELHRNLFDSSEDAHNEMNMFFGGAHNRIMSTDGVFSLSPHEHMLYLILHAYKHFVGSGIGVRQFCDIGLWAKHYYDEIDWQLLFNQCESAHSVVFAETVLKIAEKYFGIAVNPPAPWAEPQVPCEPLIKDAICGGIYGSNDYTRLHSSTVTLNALRSSRDGKKHGILASVFPKKEQMERKYPYVKRFPFLLPVAWCQRIFHYTEEMLKNSDDSVSGAVSLGKERIELMKMYDII